MSGRDVNPACPRGETVDSTRLTHLLGLEVEESNRASSNSGTKRDARRVMMMFVENGEASDAILPGMAVTFKAGSFGTKVIKATAAAGHRIEGIADHMLPAAGVAAGRRFLITVEGPTKMINDANASLAEGDILVNSPSVAGSVREQSSAPAQGSEIPQTLTIGHAEEAASASATFWGYFRRSA